MPGYQENTAGVFSVVEPSTMCLVLFAPTYSKENMLLLERLENICSSLRSTDLCPLHANGSAYAGGSQSQQSTNELVGQRLRFVKIYATTILANSVML